MRRRAAITINDAEGSSSEMRLAFGVALLSMGSGLRAVTGSEMCGDYVGEFLLMYDMSSSFKTDLETLKRDAPELYRDLDAAFPGSRYALATFSDKPWFDAGFGDPGQGDYCYQLEVPFTTDHAKLSSHFETMKVRNGGDYPESQMDAMYHGLMSAKVGWSTGEKNEDGKQILRVLILATDDIWHEAGDCVNHRSNDGSFIEHPSDPEPQCMRYDYASLEQVKYAFHHRLVQPIFLIVGNKHKPAYEELLGDVQRGGAVLDLAVDSANLIDAIKEGLGELTCGTTPQPLPTTEGPMTTNESEGPNYPVIVGSALGAVAAIAAAGLAGAMLMNSGTPEMAAEFETETAQAEDVDKEGVAQVTEAAFAV